MSSTDPFAEASRLLPGLFGSAVAMLFVKNSTPRRMVAMFIAGAAIARFGSEDMARWTGMSMGFTGFLLGLFGMSIVALAFETLPQLQLASILTDALRRLLRLSPKD